MVRRAMVVVVSAVAFASLVGACGGSDDDTGRTVPTVPGGGSPSDRARSFLVAVEEVRTNDVCAMLTDDLLEGLGGPGGGCTPALQTLTDRTGAGEDSAFATKRVGDTTFDADREIAVVMLTDRVTAATELPMRVVRTDRGWLIDEFGAPAALTKTCIEEFAAVTAAVDAHLSASDRLPTSIEQLVPSRLPTTPVGHEISPDGEVTSVGLCA